MKKQQKSFYRQKNRLKELRARENLTQGELANMVGVRRETIVFVEKGKYMPSLSLAYSIAKIFKMNIEDIFSLSEHINRENNWKVW